MDTPNNATMLVMFAQLLDVLRKQYPEDRYKLFTFGVSILEREAGFGLHDVETGEVHNVNIQFRTFGDTANDH